MNLHVVHQMTVTLSGHLKRLLTSLGESYALEGNAKQVVQKSAQVKSMVPALTRQRANNTEGVKGASQ